MTDLTFTLQSIKHQLFFVKFFFDPMISYADFIWYLELKIMIQLWYWQHLGGSEQIAKGQFRESSLDPISWLQWELCHESPASPLAGFQSMLNEALKGNSPVLPNVGWHRSMQNHAGIGLYPFVKYVLLSYVELQLIFSCCNVSLLWFESRCACRHFVDMLDMMLFSHGTLGHVGTCSKVSKYWRCIWKAFLHSHLSNILTQAGGSLSKVYQSIIWIDII